MSRLRRVAMGDPQAPFDRVLSVLDRHRLLDGGGRLKPEVELTTLGDYFDWGGLETRDRAASDALRLLDWLTSHPPEQVRLVLGNHDLCRVGELSRIDDAAFEAAFEHALRTRAATSQGDAQAESRFLRAWPDVPTSELVARDMSSFRQVQRARVVELLRSRRLKIAFATAPDVLVLHAGMTVDDLVATGLPAEGPHDAGRIACALDASLDLALDGWSEGPLRLPGLHAPGDAIAGEGGGIFYHRPAHPDAAGAGARTGPNRRRFDPRRLPPGLTQVIGHIQDRKCRQLLGPWCVEPPAGDGPLRSLVVEAGVVRYAGGVARLESPETARMIFTDGSMAKAELDAFELLDLDRLQPLERS